MFAFFFLSPECPPGQFVCAGSRVCLSDSARCDGQLQCADGSDEWNCTVSLAQHQHKEPGCLEGDWTCKNKICIPKELRCNGANDCMDNSDETDCGELWGNLWVWGSSLWAGKHLKHAGQGNTRTRIENHLL